MPEEKIATNDDIICAEFNQELSRGHDGPRDEDLQHVPDDRKGGDHAQLPAVQGHASIREGATAKLVLDTYGDITRREQGVAPAHEQPEATSDKTPDAEHEVQDAGDVRDDDPQGEGDAPLMVGVIRLLVMMAVQVSEI